MIRIDFCRPSQLYFLELARDAHSELTGEGVVGVNMQRKARSGRVVVRSHLNTGMRKVHNRHASNKPGLKVGQPRAGC